MFAAQAIASAPKPTWESPSPIIEKRFKTRLTPKSAAQSEIKTPATSARFKNGCVIIRLIASGILFTPGEGFINIAFKIFIDRSEKRAALFHVQNMGSIFDCGIKVV